MNCGDWALGLQFGPVGRLRSTLRRAEVADLPFGGQHDRGLAVAVANRVQFRVEAAPGASDTARKNPLFRQTGCGAVGFQAGSVDYRRSRRPSLRRRGREDAVEDARLAPPHEAVVEGFVGTVERGAAMARGVKFPLLPRPAPPLPGGYA